MPNPSAFARWFPSALLLSCLFAVPPPASADNFLVNNGGWSVDVAPGNGTCADAGGQCTLHAAIMEGNFGAGSHTITFSVPMVTLGGNLQQLRAPFTITGALPARTIVNGNGFDCFSLTDSGDIPPTSTPVPTARSCRTWWSRTAAATALRATATAGSSSTTSSARTRPARSSCRSANPAQPATTATASRSRHRGSTPNQTNDLLQDLFAAIPAQPLDSSQITVS